MKYNIYTTYNKDDECFDITFVIHNKLSMFVSEFSYDMDNQTLWHTNMTCGPRAGHKHLCHVNNRNRTPAKRFHLYVKSFLQFLQKEFPGTEMETFPSDDRRMRIYMKGLNRLGLKYRIDEEVDDNLTIFF